MAESRRGYTIYYVEQRSCFLKIGRVEAFGELVINWREDVLGFRAATLFTNQAERG